MNKSELVAHVAEASGLDNAAAGRAVDAVFDGIGSALASGDKVSVAGFGTFEARERSARTGRNPQSGETIEIAARTVPAFKPGSALKDRVDAS